MARAVLLACALVLTLGMTLVVRSPDIRVDTRASTTRTKLPDVTVDGQRIAAVWLDRKVFPAFEVYFNRSTDLGATFESSDERLNTDFVEGDVDSNMSNVIIESAGDSYLFVVFVDAQNSDHDGFVTHSSDGGVTWAVDQEGISQDDLDFLHEDDHGIAVSPGGKAFVIHADGRDATGLPDSPYQSVWFRKTLNGGTTWDAEVRINDVEMYQGSPTEANEQSRQAVVCADGGGHVYVAWRDKRDPTDPSTNTEFGGRIVLKASGDDGVTFGPETRLDLGDGTPGTESARPAIACRSDGTVAVVWQDLRAGAGDVDIYANVSTDGGATWQLSDIRVDTGTPAGSDATAPQINITGGSPATIHVAWEDNRDGGRDVYFARSTDGGLTWGTDQRLNIGALAGAFPVDSWDMDADGSLVVVSWADERNGTNDDVFANASIDGGATFGGPIRLDLGSSPGTSNSIEVAVSSGTDGYATVYTDFRNNSSNGDIYSGGETLSASSGDDDNDGVLDTIDNCVGLSNPGQEDRDQDGIGDLCDTFPDDPLNDADGDGVGGDSDNCPTTPNTPQTDGDGDGFGDACDLCTGTTDKVQRDLDGDGTGDLCDSDVDGDGTTNGSDADDDDDGEPDVSDNCDFVPNAAQLDEDSDGEGDECDDDDLIVSGLRISPLPLGQVTIERIDWDPEMAAESYDVLFGRTDGLPISDPGFCFRGDLLVTYASSPELPGDGEAFWYLTTAFDGTIDGSPGLRVGGVPRPIAAVCDATSAADWDLDGVRNDLDICPLIPDPAQLESDGDGIGDACEACPNDGNKTVPGQCGCGNPDTDTDGDGDADCVDTCTDTDGDGFGDPGFPINICPTDLCPSDAAKVAPEQCGCGVAETDTDIDGTADCNDTCTDTDGDGFGDPGFPANTCTEDQCPADGTKSVPGQCGCGVADTDTDSDGTADCNDTCTDTDGDGFGDPGFPANTCTEDQCPADGTKSVPGVCGCGTPDIDTDSDGTLDCLDTCTDTDGDGFGDPGFPANTCTEDECPADGTKSVPGQCGCGIADTDTDSDGTADCNDTCTDTDGDGFGDPGFPANTCTEDQCPADGTKSVPGQCGCGVADTDTDSDGTADCNDTCTDTDGDGFGDPGFPANTCTEDQCPADGTKSVPGQCGCGIADTDTDSDGTADCNDTCTDTDGDGFGDPGFPANTCTEDQCPADGTKSVPGQCGCGVADTDTDSDGTADCNDTCTDTDGDGFGDPGFPANTCTEDQCPADGTKSVPGQCGCGVADTDTDSDGTADCNDTCTDTDGDGFGDPGFPANTCTEDQCPADGTKSVPGQCGCGIADTDTDSDGTADCNDTCTDTDGDGFGDPGFPANTCTEDQCPADGTKSVPGQCGCGIADTDTDSDGTADCNDTCTDTDGDGFGDPGFPANTCTEDQCPADGTKSVPGQCGCGVADTDTDSDGTADCNDTCTDTDGDGFGDPGFPANTCTEDQCPADGTKSVPGQCGCGVADTDTDSDGTADCNDTCTDTDGDGFGDPGFPANTCTEDQCPADGTKSVPGQCGCGIADTDTDSDGTADCNDTCTDTDGDGFGDPGFPANTCTEDQCPADGTKSVPGQCGCGIADTDTDSDGTADCNDTCTDTDGDGFGDPGFPANTCTEDQCPADGTKSVPGQCGCGVADTDTDSDGTADCNDTCTDTDGDGFGDPGFPANTCTEDQCPADGTKSVPGQCGCGVADTDTDSDGTADCNDTCTDTDGDGFGDPGFPANTCTEDQCPADGTKSVPGQCGCGVADTDTDSDGTADCNDTCTDTDGDGFGDPGFPANTCTEDQCPADGTKSVPGQCGCGIADTDTDSDGTADCNDTCTDTDGDGFGDPGFPANTCTEDQCPADGTKSVPGQCGCGVADTDTDSDGTADCNDTCTDTDGDGFGDPGFPANTCTEDQCPADGTKSVPGQCGCGVADTDTDSDGTADCNDTCTDTDGDGFGDPGFPANTCTEDQCPADGTKSVPGQCGCGIADTDTDSDGTADCNDTCTDTDGDGFGDPGFPANTCTEDQCPADGTKSVPGQCGCGIADTDTDSDGTADCNDTCTDTDGDGFGDPGFPANTCTEDQCPADGTKSVPGQCGCGVADTDTDSDGTADCNDTCTDTDGDGFGDPGFPANTCTEDQCPADGTKSVPGQCGCGVADTDTDSDGTADCNDTCTDTDGDGFGDPGFPANTCTEDQCPADGTKSVPGQCGCGVADTDTDSDGTADCNDTCTDTDGDGFGDPGFPANTCTEDQCPADGTKSVPGQCGCGNLETDTDADGTADCVDTCTDTDGDGFGDPGFPVNTCIEDQCPVDGTKSVPGQCGCGVADTDTDSDGTADCIDTCTDTDGDGFGDPGFPANTCTEDQCPADGNKSVPGNCGCGNPESDDDTDYDGTSDCLDSFPDDPLNDADGDGLGAESDNCPSTANLGQADSDGDGFGDDCDLCNGTTDVVQRDLDSDGTGDLCDIDNDGDGSSNAVDPDDDDDGVPDATDNCDFVPNPIQTDDDSDGQGDACDDDDALVNGLVVLPQSPHDTVDWDRVPSAQSYNVYFGEVTGLVATDPGFCYRADIVTNFTVSQLDPLPGVAYWYLATSHDGIAEGAPGDSSGGVPRTVAAVCNLAAATDWDQDGIRNLSDLCPIVADAGQLDADSDGVGNACDDCPNDPLKIRPLQCGCGNAEDDFDLDGDSDCIDTCTDTDRDGFGDPGFPANVCPTDQCPADPLKVAPGLCGCGVPEGTC